MTLSPGTKLGAFEITGLLGKGGMGEVYRARDTKLGRDVAIKVVSEAVSSDAEYLKRFEREARTLASLDHPNIAAIYEFQHADGQHFLVMQLVEGESLSARIKRGALPIREALPIFIQIARGLDAAHEKGIVHRDLKPANVTLTTAGDAKVLDFGIAKDITQPDVDPNAMTTPMTSSPVTGAGTLVGTPHYMSPEQARGKPVDRRTDVWAFGCCLYEALTGDMPFTGETMTDIVAGIIHKDPDWALLPADLPRELDRIVRRCLEKDLRRRPASMNDLAIALEDVETDLRTGQLETLRTTPSISDTASIRSLVVLPFENLMGDEEQNYLVDGMTEALTAELSKIRALKVTSRGSAMRYRKSDKSMPRIAQELGVDGLIEGSIFRAGDGIRITAQLIDGRTDAHLWSESFTGAMDSMLQLQGDVALAIAKAIQVAVTPEEKKQLRRHRRPISRDVQKLVWEANYAFNQQNSRGYRDAVRLYERAIEMDPECTLAYVGLVAALWVPSILGIGRPLDALEKAEQASKRALELDPDSSQAQFTAGYLEMMYHHDWDKARNHFDRAVELSPSSAEAYSGRGLWRIAMLDFEGAARDEEMARELDPMSPMHANNLGIAYACLERYEDSDTQFAEAIELSPLFVLAHVNRHAMNVWHDPTPDRLKELENLAQMSGNLPILQSNLAWAYGRLGKPDKAAAIARALESDAARRFVPPMMLAISFEAAGDSRKTYTYYDKAVEEREWAALYIAACPWVVEGERRTDPRYRALLEKLRLPESAIRRALNPAALWPKTTVAQPSQGPRVERIPRPYHWLLAAAAAVLLVAGGFFAGSMRQAPSGTPVVSEGTRIASLAVLPLDNLMEDPEQEYFVDGMTEALTAELSKIHALKVISRTSVMRYKGSEKSAREIARELGVEGLIEGSVMRVGDEVRITVQLIDAETDGHLWAGTYDNTLTNVFKLHSEVALAIADKVRVTVTPAESKRIANAPKVNPEAHEAYLRGMHFYSQTTREGHERGIEYLEKAVELDPNFAVAWAHLANIYSDSVLWGYSSPEVYPRVREAAETAVALDDSLGTGHATLGYVYWNLDWDWQRANAQFQRALDLAPNEAQVRFNAAWFYALWGRTDDAIEIIQGGLERDPRSLVLHWTGSVVQRYARQPQQALRLAEDALGLDPRYAAAMDTKGQALLMLGRYDESIEMLRRAAGIMNDPPPTLASLAVAHVAAGDTDAAREILSRMEAERRPEILSDVHFAVVYAALGEDDRAFESLERAFSARDWWLLSLRVDAQWDSLRDTPRFWELIDRIGFPTLPADHPVIIRERQYKEAITARENQSIEKIAVLPFANLSGDPEQEYFVDGMTEALTMELARIKSIKILSRTSAMQYKGVLRPMHEIAEELGVDALVEGSVMRAGNQVRITAQLIHGTTDEHLWADRYDGTLEDILNLQSEVALAIAKEVSVAVTPEEAAELSAERQIDPEAYEAYLLGMHFWNKREIPESLPHFEKAIGLAPDFARAYSGLANAHGLMATFSNVDPAIGFQKSMDLARKALEIDPDLPEARAALAWAEAVFEGDFAASNERFLSIQRDYPDYSPAYYWYATTLVFQGRNEEAFEITEKAIELDPIAIPVTRLRVLVYWTADRYEEAIEYGLQHLDFAPADDMVIGIVANAYVKLDRIEEAKNFLKQTPETELSSGGSLYPLPYKQLGMESEGRAVLDSLLERQKAAYVSPMEIGMLYLALGDVDHAVDYLEDWVTTSTWNIATFQIAASPILEPYNDDPRVKKLLDQIQSHMPQE